jgi:hypothetical protein
VIAALLACAPDRDPRPPRATTPAETGDSAATPPETTAPTTPTGGWFARVVVPTARLVFDRDGCLVREGALLPEGAWLDVLGADGRFVLVDGDGGVVRADDVELVGTVDDAPPAEAATIALPSDRYALDDLGCAVVDGSWAEGDVGVALARSWDGNYHGLAFVGRDLALAGARVAEAASWDAPWHSSIQLTVPIPDVGYVLGGGVVVGPRTVLTAAHLGVDVGWCYALEANTGAAASAGTLVCDNVAGPAIVAPDGVDAAIVHLVDPIPLPAATLRTTPLAAGEAVFSSRWSLLHRNQFGDSTIDRVTNENAYCEDWPAGSTFITAEPIVAPGDSGGPAWVGDELVGLVHGERCRFAFEPEEDVFVDTVALLDWLAPEVY